MPPPTGTVTLLFTDIEGSTRLLEDLGEQYAEALALHRTVLREAFVNHGGHEVDAQGDAFFVAFHRASDAVAAAAQGQLALAAASWPLGRAVRVRMGVHTGEPALIDGQFVGMDVHRGARVMSAGHGGQVLVSQATRDLVADVLPAGLTLRDLGEHRLKDLTLAQRLYQLDAGALPTTFPPLKSLENRVTNLSVQPTALLGRARELVELQGCFSAESSSIVTLTGPGGVGKTRLALQLGADLIEQFPGGVFFVALAAIGDPGLLLPTIAQTFGLREEGQRPLVDVLTDFLADRRMLLILDNVEQLLEGAAQLSELVAACPTLCVLVTSRAPLRIAAELEFAVAPLPVPSPDGTPEAGAVADHAAIALFLERARRVQPGLALTDANAAAIAAICACVDGLPLAIELAAARMRTLTPQALQRRLDQRLKVLVGGPRDAPERQRTLRGAIAWSHDLLTPPEQAVFRRLSVFAGGFTVEAAEAIVDPNGDFDIVVLDTVEALVEQSLLRREETTDDVARLAMLETIREFALERLEGAGEGAALRGRHAAWFAEAAEAAERDWWGARRLELLRGLRADDANLRRALEAAVAGDDDLAVRLVAALWPYWRDSSRLAEAARWYDVVIAKGLDSHPRWAQALLGAANITEERGEFADSRRLLEEALPLAEATGNPRIAAFVQTSLGNLAHYRGDGAEDVRCHEAADALIRQTGDDAARAYILDTYASALHSIGDEAAADAVLQEAVTIKRRLGVTHALAVSLANQAEMLITRNQLAAARAALEEAAQLRRLSAGDAAFRAWDVVFCDLGQLLVLDGELDRAHELLTTTVRNGYGGGFHRLVVQALEALAWLAGAREEPLRAARLFGAAQRLRHDSGLHLEAFQQCHRDAYLTKARSSVNADDWRAAFAEGAALSIAQAVGMALQERALMPAMR